MEATEKKMLEMREEIKQGGLGLGKRVINRYDLRHRAWTCGHREGKKRVGQIESSPETYKLHACVLSRFSCV